MDHHLGPLGRIFWLFSHRVTNSVLETGNDWSVSKIMDKDMPKLTMNAFNVIFDFLELHFEYMKPVFLTVLNPPFKT